MPAPAAIAKDLFFMTGMPRGDIAAFYYGPQDMGAGAFPLVIMAHGFGANTNKCESARLFVDAAQYFARRGVGALGFDFSGHGLSDGDFSDMTPDTRIADLRAVLDRVTQKHAGPVFLLGLSLGAAICVYVAQEAQDRLAGLVLWSCVPTLDPAHPSCAWYAQNNNTDSVFCTGARFAKDRPAQDVGAAFCDIGIPKLHVQGDADYPGFVDVFKSFYFRAPDPKQHVVMAGADHTFTRPKDRDVLFDMTARWLAAQ